LLILLGEWRGKLVELWRHKNARAAESMTKPSNPLNQNRAQQSCTFYAKLTLPESVHRLGGAPDVVWMHLGFPSSTSVHQVNRSAATGRKMNAELTPFRFQFHLYNKTATRLPEAHWIGFKPVLGMVSWL
jgi:hypothetical protein